MTTVAFESQAFRIATQNDNNIDDGDASQIFQARASALQNKDYATVDALDRDARRALCAGIADHTANVSHVLEGLMVEGAAGRRVKQRETVAIRQVTTNLGNADKMNAARAEGYSGHFISALSPTVSKLVPIDKAGQYQHDQGAFSIWTINDSKVTDLQLSGGDTVILDYEMTATNTGAYPQDPYAAPTNGPPAMAPPTQKTGTSPGKETMQFDGDDKIIWESSLYDLSSVLGTLIPNSP